jgi:hypothetical protein
MKAYQLVEQLSFSYRTVFLLARNFISELLLVVGLVLTLPVISVKIERRKRL